MKKVIVAGSRTFHQYETVRDTLSSMFTEPITIVSGGAAGPDTMGAQWAAEVGYPVEKHPADWMNLEVPGCKIRYNAHGSYNANAGMDRNKRMLESVQRNPDGGMLVAFWNGHSKGTKNMIEIARAAGVDVHIMTVPY